MAPPIGMPGLGGGGMGSSMWSSPPDRLSQSQPLQQVHNVTPTYVAPHLRQAGQQAQTPDSKPAGYVPPHLRGFNTPLTENAGQNRPVPPHLQVRPTIVISSQGNGVAMQNSPAQNNGTQKYLASDHQVPMVAQPAVAVTEKLTIHPVQPISGLKLSHENDFLAKMKMDAEVKKKAVAEKVRSAQVHAQSIQAQPEQTPAANSQQNPSEVQPYMLLPARSKFRPTEASDNDMRDFLSKKATASATNGKKYVYSGGQQSPQTLPATSKPARDDSRALQVASANRKENTSPFGKVDPHSAFSPQDFAAKISPQKLAAKNSAGNEIRFEEPNGRPLSVDALIAPGFEPRRSSDNFDDKISDTGVGDNPKENVRAAQGPKNELVDWDGKMMPPPVDWETDRGTFDNSFMPKYIAEDWEPKVPHGPSAAVDTTAEEFQLAVPVASTVFVAPPEQPLTFADYANSDNQKRQRIQTAEISSATISRRYEKQNKNLQLWAAANEAHDLVIASRESEVHPYAPTIDTYLRPATQTDLKGIADIYNHYVLAPQSIVTEDQAAITEEDVAFLINHTKGEQLPIVVAIRGKMPLPSPNKVQNRVQQSGNNPLPQFEGIIGFGYAETYCYGIAGGRTGRTRFTANIHFYVHPEYTGKKVGRSLLDRLIKSLSHGYGAKDGYDWMNPTNDPIYNPGGVQRWHQIIVPFAVQPKDDPNYERMKNFLHRYFFDEEGRLSRIARSSIHGFGSPNFVDIVFFVKEASASTEFSPID